MNNESGHSSLDWSKGDFRAFQNKQSKNKRIMQNGCPTLEETKGVDLL